MKKFLFISVFIFLFSSKGFSEIINKIEITGNKRISDQTVLILGNISINENFDNTQLNNSLKKLYESNFFSDIKINLKDNILKIDLVENPIIEDIEFTGVKNKTFIKEITK